MTNKQLLNEVIHEKKVTVLEVIREGQSRQDLLGRYVMREQRD